MEGQRGPHSTVLQHPCEEGMKGGERLTDFTLKEGKFRAEGVILKKAATGSTSVKK